jgi:SAM-dependent methyltransferase
MLDSLRILASVLGLNPDRRRLMHFRQRLIRPAFLGTLRKTTPLSDEWGFDRGTPVDRYYIQRFLEEFRGDIRGHVLEVKDSLYTDRYGLGVDRVDVLDIDDQNPSATIIADLADAREVPDDRFDCFVLTQTLQFIYDTRAAIRHSHRILKPGGVLLATLPALGRLSRGREAATDYWRFTALSCRRLFSDVFGVEDVLVRIYGNVLSGVAFHVGMASEELARAELQTSDPRFPVLIGVRATKAN